jgi:hypothetical protein
MRTTAQYLALIPPENQGQPDFAAAITAVVDPIAQLQQFLLNLTNQFDLDNAVGAQLDIDGIWVGVSRKIPIPVADPFFRFDDVMRGFDSAFWQVPGFSQTDFLSSLDDTTYLRLIRAKILANNWDGTRLTAEAILKTYFINPSTLIWIQDNSFAATTQTFFNFDDPKRGLDVGLWFQPGETVSTLAKTDMSMTIGVAGQFPNIVDLEVLNQGLLPVKPGGVGLNVLVTSVNGDALFGFDVGNDFIAGFDSGAWGQSPADLISTQLNG